MSKIDTIESISDKLAETSISVLPKRCSYIRNWNAKCRACLNACPHDAIKRSLGHLKIDSDSCTMCGACVSSCPTSAFSTGAPSAGELVRRARLSAKANDGTAYFICSRHADHLPIDTSKIVVLPCLDYLDEYLLIGMFAFGAKACIAFKCGCEGCDVNCAEPCIDVVMDSAQRLVESWKIDGSVELREKLPKSLRLTEQMQAEEIRSDRRGAFVQTGGTVLDYARQAMDEALGRITGNTPVKEDEDKQVIVRVDEVFPPDTYRSVRLLRMLDHLGKRPYGASVESRFWASVSSDPSRCQCCGNCSKMCVTRALNFEENEDGTRTLTFTPSLCIACGLCRDSCLTRSMVYSNRVLADNLDADVVIDLYRDADPPNKKKSYFE